MDQEKSSSSSFEDLSNVNINEISPEADSKESQPVATAPEEKEKNDESMDVLGNGQLLKRIIKKSTNELKPERGDLVNISFTGQLVNGTVIEKQENMEIHVGDFEVNNINKYKTKPGNLFSFLSLRLSKDLI